MTTTPIKVLLLFAASLLSGCQSMYPGTGATGDGVSSTAVSDSGTIDFRQTLSPQQRAASAANPRAYYWLPETGNGNPVD
jgi:hypothetical protein